MSGARDAYARGVLSLAEALIADLVAKERIPAEVQHDGGACVVCTLKAVGYNLAARRVELAVQHQHHQQGGSIRIRLTPHA